MSARGPARHDPAFQADVKSGMSDVEVAHKYEISASTVQKWRLQMGIKLIRGIPKGYQRKPKPTRVMVECKCPTCEALHKVSFKVAPNVMPRVFCPEHVGLRHRPEYETFSVGRVEEENK